MALSDIFELTLKQLFGAGGEPLLTKWYYAKAGTGEDAVSCGQAFLASTGMLPLLNVVQSVKIVNDSIRVINLGDLSDFAEIALDGGGELATDALPAFAAYGYSLKVDTRAVRPGSKRIPGVSEADQADGLIVNVTLIGNLNAIASKMSVDLAGTVSDLYRPVIVKRFHDVVTGTDAHDFYRLPRIDSELVTGRVTAALLNMKVSHQVSRGNGR